MAVHSEDNVGLTKKIEFAEFDTRLTPLGVEAGSQPLSPLGDSSVLQPSLTRVGRAPSPTSQEDRGSISTTGGQQTPGLDLLLVIVADSNVKMFS
ncbi:hypothetical protein RRG08_067200 [Elysia crispata]|uniref:Uncharacterized protein n=1 Tax=Elysia crispata TaxID=231223 RepID=A0AAE0YBC5_9GAST|nr:hypothetical protein RRG08_067200 [Elysia crispata]